VACPQSKIKFYVVKGDLKQLNSVILYMELAPFVVCSWESFLSEIL